MKKLWKGENAVVLGLSKTGIASAKYLNSQGAICTISENRQPTNQDFKVIQELEELNIKVEMGENKEETILSADIIVTSPGIPPHSALIKMIRKNKIQLISEPELCYIETSIPIIAITGTNGKSTTTSLISEIFNDAGYKAPACGNIGYPIINEITKENDFLIAEVSSFQLEYSPTFKPQVAVFLNYTPDHIDWHGSEKEYLRVKTEFIKAQRSPMWLVLNACDSVLTGIGANSESDVYWFGREVKGKCCFISDDCFVIKEKNKINKVLSIADIQLKGFHNYENIMASIATARVSGISVNTIAESIKKFKAIEHRLEYVTTIDGIEFYNDSKATNCEATICALKAFLEEKIVLIAGGRDKGTDLTELIKQIKLHVNNVILIGEATNRFSEALKKSDFKDVIKANSLEEAVNKAFDLKAGPVVLSPACASYDMFNNFEERGYVFKDIVNKKK